MKYLRLFESFNEKNIRAICKKYEIEHYTINKDGSIDVDGDADMGLRKFKELPLKFRNVSGEFHCDGNQLTSLEGCPESVGSFYCSYNKLTSLKGCPKSISYDFNCSQNQLTSLEGCPKSLDGHFACFNNQLTSLEGGPESVAAEFNCSQNQLTSLECCPKSVGGDFNCANNKIITFEHLPYSVGGYFLCGNNPIKEIWDLFRDYSKIEFLNDCDAVREPDADSEEPIIILDRLNYFLEEIGKKTVAKVKGYKCI